MRLARFRIGGEGPARIGLVDGDHVAEVGGVDGETDLGVLPALAVLAGAGGGAGVGGGGGGGGGAHTDPEAVARHLGESFALADVELLAPIRRPPKFLGIGLNYAAHVDETGRQRPEFPTFFNKQSTCVIGHGAAIHLPRVSEQVDYEGELGIVVGRRCRAVPAAEAREVIAGYLVVNDVSARDWQYRAPTWTLGKSFDTHGPIGPYLVTTDEVEDPQALHISTWVNGDLRQSAPTSEMLFGCYEQIELLSTVFTLEPGDVIATGTPAGVGMARTPPEFLAAGDVVRIEIPGVGTLQNPVVAEPA